MKIENKILPKIRELFFKLVTFTTYKIVALIATLLAITIISLSVPCTIYTNKGTMTGFFADPYFRYISIAMGLAWLLYCFTNLPPFGFINMKLTGFFILFISSISAVSTININTGKGLLLDIQKDLNYNSITMQIESNLKQIDKLNKSIDEDMKWYKHYKFIEPNNSLATGRRIKYSANEIIVKKIINKNDSLFNAQDSVLTVLKNTGGQYMQAVNSSALVFIPFLCKLPTKSQHTLISIIVSFINDMLISFSSKIIIFFHPTWKINFARRKKLKWYVKLRRKIINLIPGFQEIYTKKKELDKRLEKVFVNCVTGQSNNDKLMLQNVDKQFDFVTVGQNGKIIRVKETNTNEKKEYIARVYKYMIDNNIKTNHRVISEVIQDNFGVTIKRSTVTTYLNRDIKPRLKAFDVKYANINIKTDRID